MSDDLSVPEIASMLNAQAEAVAWMVFPNGKVIAGHFCIGSIRGEPGNSLKIRLRGPRMGGWADYSEAETSPTGKGDMLKLIQYGMHDGDMGAAVRTAKQFLNIESVDPRALERQKKRAMLAREKAEARDHEDKEKSRRDARRTWQIASALTPTSPPILYLAKRGINLSYLGHIPGAIRFHPHIFHPELRRKIPAMVTAFIDEKGHAATHVTFLERLPNGDWVKVQNVKTQKQIHGRTYWGAHIPLWKGEQKVPLRDVAPGTAVEVSEGIEDGLSFAMAAPHARVLAAGSLGNIGAMRLPPQVGNFNILAQRDEPGSPAERSLHDAIRKQQEQAQAQGSRRAVNCRWTPEGIKDWNDYLQILQRDEMDGEH